jgi:hypothetical protein
MLSLEKIKYPPEIDGKGPFAEAEYLKKGGHMKGRFLGQCLNSCRWGSPYNIMYEMNPLEMTEFVKNWMEQNKENLMFHYKELPKGFELPHVNLDACPIDSTHKLRSIGLDGTLRCINEEPKTFKEGYYSVFKKFDPRSGSVRTTYMKNLPLHGDKESWDDYRKETRKVGVIERCGAIISDKGTVLSLADVIDRLNVYPGEYLEFCRGKECAEAFGELEISRKCFGHTVIDHCVFPFDGWRLARYVQKWYEQSPDGTAPFTTPAVTDRIAKKITSPDRVKEVKRKWKKIL